MSDLLDRALREATTTAVGPEDRLVIVLRDRGWSQMTERDEEQLALIDQLVEHLNGIGLEGRFVILGLVEGDEVHVIRG